MIEGVEIEMMKELEHQHVLPNGTIKTHIHVEQQDHVHKIHGHVHSHTQTKAVLNRMSRLIGHLESIKKMIESGRDCSDVLIQLSAVNAAVHGVGKVILKDHINHCIVDAIRDDDKEVLDKLNKAIDQFMK